MSKIIALLVLGLQLSIVIVFYLLTCEQKSFIRHRDSINKFPTIQDAAVFDDLRISTEIGWKEITRKPTPPVEEMNDKWIVITTINSPKEDVKKLAAIDGWKVVVVGDTKTPADWK